MCATELLLVGLGVKTLVHLFVSRVNLDKNIQALKDLDLASENVKTMFATELLLVSLGLRH